MQVITKDQRQAIKKIYMRTPLFKDGAAAQIAMNAGWTFVKVTDLPQDLRVKVTNDNTHYVWLHGQYTPLYEDATDIVRDYHLSPQISYKEFRKTVVNGFDCLMVAWQGMWLGIEKDGYVHS